VSDWLRRAEGGITLTVHVQPGARHNEVAGVHGEALKIRLAAPAIDGRANAALLEFVAKRLGVPRSALQIRSGQTSRRKLLVVLEPPTDAVQRLLGD
jgi:uncharacterized protein (TIGR00251 family)